jgi:hypothetical protein
MTHIRSYVCLCVSFKNYMNVELFKVFKSHKKEEEISLELQLIVQHTRLHVSECMEWLLQKKE